MEETAQEILPASLQRMRELAESLKARWDQIAAISIPSALYWPGPGPLLAVGRRGTTRTMPPRPVSRPFPTSSSPPNPCSVPIRALIPSPASCSA